LDILTFFQEHPKAYGQEPLSNHFHNCLNSEIDRKRRLVLHADDLGMNRAVSDGILRGFRQGLLTSTSLLANAPDAARAVEEWKKLEEERAAGGLPSAAARRNLGDPDQAFDFGIHLNLTQGRPLSGDRYPAELLDAEGRFPGVFKLFARLRHSGEKYQAALLAEFERQIQLPLDRGVRPTHLNGHQYVEMFPTTARWAPELMKKFGIQTVRVAREPSLWRTTLCRPFQFGKWPIARVKRLFAEQFRELMDSKGIAHPDAFFGTAHAGRIDAGLLRLFLKCGKNLGLVEIGLHPGEETNETRPQDIADGWDDPLAGSRPNELRLLVSNELPKMLESAGWRLGRLC
jgi:predicted glycoside hydrolase/deacetylase ChbG (UPF0249 family)